MKELVKVGGRELSSTFLFYFNRPAVLLTREEITKYVFDFDKFFDKT